MTLFALLVAPALAAEPASLTLPYVSCASLGEVWTGTSCSGDADANVLANGHNAAKVALADAAGLTGVADGPRPRTGVRKAPWQQRVVGGLMSTKPGRWVGYRAARQPALRKVTAYAARVR